MARPWPFACPVMLRRFVLLTLLPLLLSACGDAERAGLPFTLHTDTPVLRPNLLEAAWCAVNRITKAGVQLDEKPVTLAIHEVADGKIDASGMDLTISVDN